MKCIPDPNPSCREPMPLSVSPQQLTESTSSIKSIIQDNRNLVTLLVDGMFEFDLRDCEGLKL